MKLATLRDADGSYAGIVDDEDVVMLPFRDIGQMLRKGVRSVDEVRAVAGDRRPLSSFAFAPLLDGPRNVLCVGLNYRGHIEEMKREIPTRPTIFSKSSSTMISAVDDVELSSASQKWDYEAELGVVLSGGGRHLGVEEAEGLIAGYTVVNDISARDWQNHTTQWLPGKNFDRTFPVGPTMTLAETAPLLESLVVECRVNGSVVQSASCAEFVFTPADVVSYISSFMTLQAGDLIAMGTPAGVAAAHGGPWLKDGDVVQTSVTGVGVLQNVCRAVL